MKMTLTKTHRNKVVGILMLILNIGIAHPTNKNTIGDNSTGMARTTTESNANNTNTPNVLDGINFDDSDMPLEEPIGVRGKTPVNRTAEELTNLQTEREKEDRQPPAGQSPTISQPAQAEQTAAIGAGNTQVQSGPVTKPSVSIPENETDAAAVVAIAETTTAQPIKQAAAQRPANSQPAEAEETTPIESGQSSAGQTVSSTTKHAEVVATTPLSAPVAAAASEDRLLNAIDRLVHKIAPPNDLVGAVGDDSKNGSIDTTTKLPGSSHREDIFLNETINIKNEIPAEFIRALLNKYGGVPAFVLQSLLCIFIVASLFVSCLKCKIPRRFIMGKIWDDLEIISMDMIQKQHFPVRK